MSKPKVNTFTHSTQEICNEFKRCRDTIRVFRERGIFVEGRDFIRKTFAKKRPTFLWDPEAVHASLLKAGKKL
ncbi:hypothetical protein [Synechococcus elongatus]|uniref:hypothetical protein n=1 Tax=Synechococcus elongatus TaxID=32046 RepID=UPI000F7D6781|nr:hypothetical protein [Synechococcus elongatus]